MCNVLLLQQIAKFKRVFREPQSAQQVPHKPQIPITKPPTPTPDPQPPSSNRWMLSSQHTAPTSRPFLHLPTPATVIMVRRRHLKHRNPNHKRAQIARRDVRHINFTCKLHTCRSDDALCCRRKAECVKTTNQIPQPTNRKPQVADNYGCRRRHQFQR
jgi:hypothetical protein